MLKRVALLCLIVSLSGYSAIKNTKTDYQWDNIVASDFEVNTAKKLLAYRNYLNFKAKKVNAKQLTSSLSKSKLFKNNYSLVTKTNKLFSENLKLKEIRQICLSIGNEQVTSPFSKSLHHSSINYCDTKFLNKLLQKKHVSHLNKRNFDYLKKSLGRLLYKKNFSTFLSKLKRNRKLHHLVSLYTIEYIIENNAKPSKRVVSNLYPTDSLFNYLQTYNYYTAKSDRTLTREFRKRANNFERLIEKDKFAIADQKMEELLSFYNQNASSISKVTAWKYFNLSAKEYRYKKLYKKADRIFRFNNQIAPDEYRDESYFQTLWNSIIQNKPSVTIKLIDEYKMIENYTKLDSKLKFWIATSVQRNGQVHLAKHLYSEIIKSSPLNFYSIISLKELTLLDDTAAKNDYVSKFSSGHKSPDINLSHYSDDFINQIKKIGIWIELKKNVYAKREIKATLNLSKDKIFKKNVFRSQLSNDELQSILINKLARMLSQNGKHLLTFKLLQSSLGKDFYSLDRSTLQYLFPMKYLAKIKTYSSSLDPLFVLSLIRQESAFNPQARSIAGARGLMQLMPSTARSYKKKLKKSELNDPKLNIKIGVKYLSKVLKEFDGNMIYALSAYNSGEHRVRTWKKNVFKSQDPLEIIESIPYKETRIYVKLIYRNMFFYNFLNDDINFHTPLNESFKVSMN